MFFFFLFFYFESICKLTAVLVNFQAKQSLMKQSYEPRASFFNLTLGPEAIDYRTMLLTYKHMQRCMASTWDTGEPIAYTHWWFLYCVLGF